MPLPEDHFIDVARLTTRYWAGGQGASTVIFLHGLGGSVETWWPVWPTLAERFSVYALDLPGHGYTGASLSAPCHAMALACFVRDFMAAIQVGRASLIGHSLGGVIALHCALRFPHLVDRLVLVESAGLGKEATRLLGLASLPALGEVLLYTMSPGIYAAGLRQFVHDPSVWTEDVIRLSYHLATQPGRRRAHLRTLRAFGDIWGQHAEVYSPIVRGLGRIESQTLILWGRQDRALPLAHAHVAARGLRRAHLVVLDGCGHFPMLEQTEAFVRAVDKFLAD